MPRPKPHTRRSLPGITRAFERLQALLESGAFPPGSRLPAERDLCQQCHVSRMTLRRALARLRAAGRIESRVGSGTFVTQPNPATHRPAVALMYTTADAVPPGLLGRARQRGCELALYAQGDAQWDPAAERQFLRQARDQRQRGLLAFCTPKPPHNDALLRDLERCGVRVLHIEHYRIEPPEQPYLLPDFRRAGHMAAVALLIAGYRYLYIVGYPGAPSPFEQLLELGFADALREHRPDLDPASCQREFPQFEDGVDTDATYQAKLVRLMRELPAASGLVVHVADHADRLLAAARQAGIAVPERCGLIGIDVAGPGKPARAGTVDSLVFDRPALLQRALDCVLANDWHPPRELVMPVHVRRNTIRARH